MQCSYCTNAIHCERHSLRDVEHSTRWNRCKLHLQIILSILHRFRIFMQLWNALIELYNNVSFRHYNMCGNCVASNAAIARTQYRASDIRFEMSSIQAREQLKQLRQMQISLHNIICTWHRYNVIFASLKCVRLNLQFDVITSLSYVEMLDVQQLHNRITSKILFWCSWKCDSKV